MVPISAEATVKPNQNSSSPNTDSSASVVPEITAVSKPKRRPPSAATMVLKKTVRRFMIDKMFVD